MNRKTLKLLGIALTLMFLFAAIGAITLAAIMYRPTSPVWRPNSWGPLGALMIAAMITVFVFALPVLLALLYPKRILLAIAIVLLLLSALFVWAIGIMALIGATHGSIATTFGCRTEFDGFFDSFRSLDYYIQQADSRLCTASCPCTITNIAAYSANPIIAPFIQNWVVNPTGGAFNFQSCPPTVHQSALLGAAVNNATYYDPEFDQTELWNYYSWMEENFNCAGWCGGNYLNPILNRQVPITKYLFTDINRGPPQYIGCLNYLIEWLPDLLIAFGSLALLTGLLQMLTLIPLLLLCYAKDKAEGTYVERRPVTVVERREPVVGVAAAIS